MPEPLGSYAHPSDADELLRHVDEAISEGNIEGVVDRRRDLLDWANDSALDETRRIRAAILASQLFLPRMEVRSAAQSLSPYLTSGKTIEPRRKPIQRLKRSNSKCLGGLALAEMANVLFRSFRSEEGEKLGIEALELLKARKSDQGGFGSLFVELSVVLAHVWWARLAWQVGKEGEARACLDEQLDRLGEMRWQYPAKPGGINWAAAIVLDLSADLALAAAQHDLALRQIERALILMQDGVHDSPRLGHILYVAGRVAGSFVDRKSLGWPVRLFERSKEAYPDDHPFQFRAANQMAQCFVKAGDLTKAEGLLTDAVKRLEEAKELASDQRAFCQAELRLTRIWILERRAQAGMLDWTSCRSEAAELLRESEDLPRRLQGEAALHYALSLVACGEPRAALRHLERAGELAAKDGRATLDAAVRLAFVEAHLRAGNERNAMRAWEHAEERLSTAKSGYLQEWRERLASRMNKPLSILLHPDWPLKAAESEFRKSYLRFQIERSRGVMTTLAQNIQVPRTTLLRWIKELDLEGVGPERRRGRPPRSK